MIKNTCSILLFSLYFLLLYPCFLANVAQADGLPVLYTRKNGLLLGVQAGRDYFIEIGAEKQWRKITLRHPSALGLGFTAGYGYRPKQLIYNVFGWHRTGRLALTYGLNACVVTDFEAYRFGGGPQIGLKLIGFHFLTGINILTKPAKNFQTNQLYITVRYFFLSDRTWKWKKK